MEEQLRKQGSPTQKPRQQCTNPCQAAARSSLSLSRLPTVSPWKSASGSVPHPLEFVLNRVQRDNCNFGHVEMLLVSVARCALCLDHLKPAASAPVLCMYIRASIQFYNTAAPRPPNFLQAIRVLLRLGVDVTARGGAQSSFPDLTAYQVGIDICTPTAFIARMILGCVKSQSVTLLFFLSVFIHTSYVGNFCCSLQHVVLVGDGVGCLCAVVLCVRCLQVALSGRCKGNPEEIKQIFLTEAVQVSSDRSVVSLLPYFVFLSLTMRAFEVFRCA